MKSPRYFDASLRGKNMNKTALLIIDYINDIAHAEGKISGSAAFIKEHNVIENVNRIITFSRQNKIPAVFIKVGFNRNYLECPENSPIFSNAKKQKALLLNTWGTEFYETLDRQPDDLIIIKHRVSAFYATPLEAFLHANHIQNLLIAGVSTDMAVQTTAREAHDHDYKVFVVADACAAASEEVHEMTLKLMQRIAVM